MKVPSENGPTIKYLLQMFNEIGRHKDLWAHIRRWGTTSSSRFRSKRQKNAQTAFLMKSNQKVKDQMQKTDGDNN